MDQLGPYRLERHLATGGMADVWLATQEGPEGFRKEVVIKRIRGLRADDDDFRTMFLDEARLTARLNHPNIVQIHELGEVDGEFFVAMEYVEGCDLSEVLERDGRLPWHLALHIAEQLLLALIFVSELEEDGERLDIVHRDISPSNLLLSKTGHVKLADFGVAKALSNHHRTQTGATKGKLSFMSPEQVRADQLDARSDIFAVGVNLYVWITGELPFGDGVRALHAIQAEPHRPVSELVEVPPAVEALVDRALQKDPEHRFPSAEAMHDAIVEIFRSEPVHADRRDVSELVSGGIVDATEPAVPAMMPTEPQIAPDLGETPPPVDKTSPTAVVGPRVDGPHRPRAGSIRESSRPRRPARLPWILVGVLFGVLVAGGASTVALMVTDDAAPTVAPAATADEATVEESSPPANGSDSVEAEKASEATVDQKAKKPKKPKKGKPHKRDDDDEDEREDRAEEAEEEAEERREKAKAKRKRDKRQRELEKRLEKRRKKLEREAKKLGEKAIRDILEK